MADAEHPGAPPPEAGDEGDTQAPEPPAAGGDEGKSPSPAYGSEEDRSPSPASGGDEDKRARRLRECGEEELLRLVRAWAADLLPEEARQALRNPFCTLEVVEALAAQARLLAFYEVRRDLSLHPRTPETLAFRFLPGLYWRDLMLVGLDTRLRPSLRRAAEQHLLARLPEVALGERIALARRASAGVLLQLRHDPNPRVMAALLDNPRLTEGTLAPLLHSATTAPAILDVVMQDRRWGVRYGLRLAVARNPAARERTVLPLLPSLRKVDLRAVAADPKLGAGVRQRARLLLGEWG